MPEVVAGGPLNPRDSQRYLHHGGQHPENVFFGCVLYGDDIAFTHRKCLARTHDSSGGPEALTVRGRKEIHFVFHGKNGVAPGSEGEGCETACAVHDCRHQPGVHITVLLSELLAKRKVDYHDARFDAADLRLGRFHHGLKRERGTSTGHVIRICRDEGAHEHIIAVIGTPREHQTTNRCA